ncbi:MAG: transketolase [Candidatus Paceibacterota bacterium]
MSNLSDDKICELEQTANRIRQSIIAMLVSAGSGHTAGPLGMADIFTYLYFGGMSHDPKNPKWTDRDRLILSNGHICPVLYATMAHAGYFPLEELETLRQFGSRLQGHPHREFLPMLENSSGPLGSGLSQALGMALADRIDYGKQSRKFFFCLTGDGELNEGQNWEAIMMASKEKVHNLIVIVDRNNIQIDGFTEDIMPLNSLRKKFEAFNFHVQEIDGHNFEAISDSINQAKAVYDMPSVIIAHTIPGKGVPFMERDYRWHGVPPGKGPEDFYKKDEQNAKAIDELRSLGGKIKCGDK